MWERLARAGSPYTRPQGRPPQTNAGIRRFLDPRSRLRGVRLRGARILALAAGGGWDAILFAKLGAATTLMDISRRQLDTVRGLARKERVRIRFVQGNMKDLSVFPDASFEVVWHAHSLVFADDAPKVLQEVGRVLAPGGTYRMSPDGLWEYSPKPPNPRAKPGSDEHLESLFPAYIEVRARRPGYAG